MPESPCATGQMVRIARRSMSGPSTDDHFKIARRYVNENGPAIHHVRSPNDPGERMVPEDELAAAMPGMFERERSLTRKVLGHCPEAVRFDHRAIR